jgi:D-sedoheptulose 7-phosphate isomerase
MTGSGKSSRARRLADGARAGAAAIGAVAAQADRLADICELIIAALRRGGKLLVAGNGGSAAEAMHMAEELVGRFRTNRRPLPAVALAADGTALTCIGNDFGFEHVFSRQVTALGRPGDVLILFSTSGNSPNLLLAMDAARARKVKTVCLLGRDGGKMRGRGTRELIVNVPATANIQEAHQCIMHLILEEVEGVFGLTKSAGRGRGKRGA